MGKNPRSMPSFFKVLISDDFNRQLRLPPAFFDKLGQVLPKSVAQLRTSSGHMWQVNLEKHEDQNYYFSGGWAKFCEDLGLAIGEFLVFWYCGRAIFDVSVYGINACEREITAINDPVEDSDPDEAVNSDPVAGHSDVNEKSEDGDWIDDPLDESDAGKIGCFYRKLDHRRSCRLDVPKAFVVSCGCGIGGDRMIHLQDSKSRLWPVQLASWPRKDGGHRFSLTAGWNAFLVGNKAAIGSTVLLECEGPGGSLVKAKVLNYGRMGGKLIRPRGRKLRPSKVCMRRGFNTLPCKEECVFF